MQDLSNSPNYRLILQEGREEGIKAGIQQGQTQAFRDAIIDIVTEHFPELVSLAEQRTADITEPMLLRHILLRLSTLHSTNDAREFLRRVSSNRKAEIIRLLQSWREEDEKEDQQEQQASWEELKRALDEDRLSDRKLFP